MGRSLDSSISIFINIRGTNGSGKSTLARSFFEGGEQVLLNTFVNKNGREKAVVGQRKGDLCVVGDYSTMAGGLDKIPTFEVQFQAIETALLLRGVRVVIAEGVLASTVFGSWARHAQALSREGVHVVWAYLQTPLDVCLSRIQERNGGKPIKEDLVAGKWAQIDRTREKAEQWPWVEVMKLPYGEEREALAGWIS